MRTTKVQISLRIRAVWSAPLLFRYLDSITPLVSISEISSLHLASVAAQASLWFASYLIANPEDRFSHDEAHIGNVSNVKRFFCCKHLRGKLQWFLKNRSLDYFLKFWGREWFCSHLVYFICLFCCLTSKSTTMVMSRRSVNLVLLFNVPVNNYGHVKTVS